MRKIIVAFLFVVLSALPAYAEGTITLDLTGSTMTPTAADSFRLHDVQAFSDGVSAGNFWADVTWDPVNFVFVPVNYGPETTDPVLERSQWLKGKWFFAFTILADFSSKFTLTTVDTSQTNSEGGYYVDGTDDSGNIILASYYPHSGWWMILDPGLIVDEVFVFYTDGTIVLPNSYYFQADPTTAQIISDGYTLYGYKYSSSTAASKRELRVSRRASSQIERAQEANPGVAPKSFNDAYRALRDHLQ